MKAMKDMMFCNILVDSMRTIKKDNAEKNRMAIFEIGANVRKIHFENIHVRTTEAENYKLEKNPERLVKETSIAGGGRGVIRKTHCQ